VFIWREKIFGPRLFEPGPLFVGSISLSLVMLLAVGKDPSLDEIVPLLTVANESVPFPTVVGGVPCALMYGTAAAREHATRSQVVFG
jgi:hypothetical protein